MEAAPGGRASPSPDSTWGPPEDCSDRLEVVTPHQRKRVPRLRRDRLPHLPGTGARRVLALVMVDDAKIRMGDAEKQRRACDLYVQLVSAYVVEVDKELVGQVTGDVVAEIRSDPELCAAFLYLVGVGFDACLGRISEGTGIPGPTFSPLSLPPTSTSDSR